MTFREKFAAEYRTEFLGLLHALSGGTDITEGSPDAIIGEAIGLMMQTFDARLRSLVNARGLRAIGRDADEVVEQIMSGVPVVRQGAIAANGPVMTFERSDTVGALVVPSGVVLRSGVDPSLEFKTTEEFTFSDGQSVFPSPSQRPVAIVALQPGTRSNAPAGTVTVIVSGAPSQLESCTNSVGLTNGEDEETTESLLQRAQLMVAAIAKSQPAALQALAQRFVGSDGTTIRNAVVYEPPDIPGYAELVVSDGFGLQGYTAPAAWQTGTAGPNGQATIVFDGPAATEPLLVIDPDPLLPVGSGATPAGLRAGTVVLHERGVIEFVGARLPPGTTWAVGGHLRYTGVIAELQARVEGQYLRGTTTDYGWRACGTRQRVRPPIVDVVPFTLRLRLRLGVDVASGQDIVRQIVISYLASLGIGETLNLFRLTDKVGNYADAEDFEVLSPPANIAAIGRRHQFATFAHLITFVGE